MKKIFAFVLVATMSLSAMAQHEIGAVVGGLNGLSYKYWFSDNLAVQADLAVGLTTVPGSTTSSTLGLSSKFDSWGVYDFTINPNLLYHIDLPKNFKFYLGGGANFGLVSDLDNTDKDRIMGKFGLNGNVGVCYRLSNVPLALAFDFRPGYGLAFTDAAPKDFSMHYFDWKLGFAIRYCL